VSGEADAHGRSRLERYALLNGVTVRRERRRHRERDAVELALVSAAASAAGAVGAASTSAQRAAIMQP